MVNRADVYCNLFVDSNLEQSHFANNLASVFNQAANKQGNFDTSFGNIYVIENDDYDELKKTDKEEGFLFYRYLLEVEPRLDLDINNAIEFVSKLLNYLWSLDYPATAACSYEDKLPNKGKLVPMS
jgi:hypothetical protein